MGLQPGVSSAGTSKWNTPRFNIILHASTSYSTLLHHTPRFYIILQHLTSYSTFPHRAPRSRNTSSIKLATTPPPSQLPTTNVHRVPTFPAGWMEKRRSFPPRTPAQTVPWCEIGESFPPKDAKRAKRGRRFCGEKVTGKSLAAHPPGADVKKTTCHVDEGRRRVRPRLAERAGTHPKKGGGA